MALSRFVVGIDLGTTHTVVAFASLGSRVSSPEVFEIPQLVSASARASRSLLPSVLYAPLEAEQIVDPWGDPPWVTGELAQRRGLEVPGRVVVSAKSWLCHPAVDRTAAILPWGSSPGTDEGPRVSPRDASARLLSHVQRAWDAAHPEAPLADQDVVLTVPASFDEVARELTVSAAELAGLHVRLLEEPQAAFYDYRSRAGDAVLSGLVADGRGANEPPSLVLVCDVGGGTTDLSLLRIDRAQETAALEITRTAVGRHLLLGGDNMDLALAHLCEARFGNDERLDPARYGQLLLACRAAKEALLSEGGPDDVGVSVARPGARFVGGTLSARLSRDEVLATVLEGFFPPVSRDAEPVRPRGGLFGFGLPYERDIAITRHVAAFFRRHAEGAQAPCALLLNGGVFHAAPFVRRIAETLAQWGGSPVPVLPHTDPDLAVARGAVAFGLARAGARGPSGKRAEAGTIKSGSARGYYVEVGSNAGTDRAYVCVVPRGTEEGVPLVASATPLALVVGRAARFDLFASDNARGHSAGELVTSREVDLDPLPPVFTAFEDSDTGQEAVRVALQGELSAIGTLDLACVELEPSGGRVPRRFRLAFNLRGAGERRSTRAAPASASDPGRTRVKPEALAAIQLAFGKSVADAPPRAAKDLVRELERILGDRGTWDAATTRALFDVLWAGQKARRRSLDHERVFWQLAGFCLRPGVGDAGDAARVKSLFSLFADKLAFPEETRSWQQFWFAWRRVAAGLDEGSQLAFRDAVDPFLSPRDPSRRPPKWKPDALDALLETASSFERVPPKRRAELGAWLLERTWTDRDPRIWAALGRLGARMPAYASASYVIAPGTIERWVDHLLREKWTEVPTACEAALRLARLTGDRARDLPDRVRREVHKRLLSAGVVVEQARAVLELVEANDRERAAFLGEGIPVGLRLVE